jgi:hypothetical protein
MKEVGLQAVTYDTRSMMKHIESSVNVARREYGICCLGVGIVERSI